jgi:hypothetical protein
MNSPTGFDLVNGRLANIDPIAAMLNPAALPQTLHMTLAAYASTGFIVAGIHALGLLRDPRNGFHRRHIATGVVAVGAIGALWIRRYRLARLAAVTQVSLILWGWALAQYPYLLPPALHHRGRGAGGHPDAHPLGPGGRALVLFPSLVYLLRVFKRPHHARQP